MKKIISILTCLLLLCACEANKDESPGDVIAEAVYRLITAKEARDLMDSAESYILLDVRTEEEYRERRIKDAILIPDYEIGQRASAELPDKNAVILIYCRSGRRSADAANTLVSMGYTLVYDFGGIIDWPYETVE
jgi:rhodanese-related sulfurtransferase